MVIDVSGASPTITVDSNESVDSVTASDPLVISRRNPDRGGQLERQRRPDLDRRDAAKSNGGTTQLNGGTIASTGTGATFTVSQGATLDLTGGTDSVVYSGSFTGTGAGTVSLASGELVVGSGGRDLRFSRRAVPVDRRRASTSTVGPSPTPARSRSLTPRPSHLFGNTSGSGGGLGNQGGSLVNEGTIARPGAGSLTLYDSVQIDNAASGTYDITGNGGFDVGNDSPFMTNAGLFETTVGTGTTTIALAV